MLESIVDIEFETKFIEKLCILQSLQINFAALDYYIRIKRNTCLYQILEIEFSPL